MAETQHILQQAINLGTPKHTPRRAELKKQLGQSAAVFSAFRVHRQAEHLAGLLTDEHGHRRPFHQWAKEAQPYLNHQNRAWLQTEYNQAISRAHNEADWQRFKQDADLFPNLEWMPSTSITPGADHQPFWGTILPIEHPFWGEHRPGDRWGCKCQLRSTDAAPTAAPTGSALTAMRPAPGLGSAPGSGQLFSSDHPYYPTNCTACPYASITDKLRALASGKRNDCNNCKTVLRKIEELGPMAKSARKAVNVEMRSRAQKFVEKELPLVELSPKVSGYRKTYTIGSRSLILTKKFFDEVFAKSVRNNSCKQHMQTAMEVKEWLPKIQYVRSEMGKHHRCTFNVYIAEHNGLKLEIKTKVTDAEYLYNMRIVG